MKKKIFNFLVIMTIAFHGHLQNLGLQWGGGFGGGSAYATRINNSTHDSQNNIISTGCYSGTSDFDLDPSVVSVLTGGSPDIYVAKHNSSGDLLWKVSFNNSGYSCAYGVATDSQDNIIITGFFIGSMDADPGPGVLTFNSMFDAAFLIKLSPSGTLIFAEKITDNNSMMSAEFGNSVVVDANDNIIMTSEFDGQLTFNTSQPNSVTFNSGVAATFDQFVAKYSPTGTLIWARQIENISTNADGMMNRTFDITVDSNNDIVLLADFRGVIDLDPSSNVTSISSPDTGNGNGQYILKLDGNGLYIWHKIVTQNNNDDIIFTALKYNSLDELVIVGKLISTFDFVDFGSSNISPTGIQDGLMMKLDNNGNSVWIKHFGSIGSSAFIDPLDFSSNDNIIIGGTLVGPVDMDPSSNISIENANSTDNDFISVYDTNGDFIFSDAYDAQGVNILIVDESDAIITIGRLIGTADLDPGANQYQVSSNSQTPRYMAKFCESVLDPTITVTQPLTCLNDGTLTSNYTTNNIWNGIPGGQDLIITSPGSYILEIADGNNCSISVEQVIQDPVTIIPNEVIVDACNFNNGSITLNPTGGAAPYGFNFDGAGFQSENSLCGLEAGQHSVDIIDHNLCVYTLDYDILDPNSSADFDYPNGLVISSTNGNTLQDLNNDGIIKVRGVVKILENTTYNLSNAVVEFSRDDIPYSPDQGHTHSGMIVMPEADVTITNCDLKGSSQCGSMWQGIQVWGYFDRTEEYTDPKYKNLLIGGIKRIGKLQLDDVQIRDAHIGVACYRVFQPFNQNITDYGMGELTAHNSEFINNNIGIGFHGITNQENLSAIRECDFRNDGTLIDDCKYDGKGIKAFIQLKNVRRPIIEGNSFLGYDQFDIDQRGTGVLSYDASYNVKSGRIVLGNNLPLIPNSFEDLSKGVDAYSASGGFNYLIVKDNVFTNVYQSVTTNGSKFDEISFNNFYQPTGDVGFNSWGVYNLSAEGTYVTENTFKTDNFNAYTFGSVTRNSFGMQEDVYKNTFTNAFEAATQMEQNNSDLQVDCNKYLDENTHDWRVTSGFLEDQGLCVSGIDEQQTTNVFSVCNSTDDNIFLNASVPTFEYSSETSFQPGCAPSVTAVICQDVVTFNNVCQTIVDLPCENCLDNLISLHENAANNFEEKKLKSRLVRGYYIADEYDDLYEFLINENSVQDKFVLVPNYIEIADFDAARDILDNLDLTVQQENDFYELYDIVLTVYEDDRTIDELTLVERNSLELIANSSNEFQNIAEALIAKIDEVQYLRKPEDINGRAPSNTFTQEETESNLIENSREITIFPNPSTGIVNINFGKEKVNRIVVFDYLGKQILKKYVVKSNEKLNLQNVSSGVYLIRILLTDGSVLNKKIVIND